MTNRHETENHQNYELAEWECRVFHFQHELGIPRCHFFCHFEPYLWHLHQQIVKKYCRHDEWPDEWQF